MPGTAGGKVWLITGSSSGLGRAVAEAALAAEGLVVATARRPEALDDLVTVFPGRVTAVRLDVTDHGRCSEVIDQVVDLHGRLDVLVNNAGFGLIGAVEESTDRELRALMEVHFFGPAALVRAALPHMRTQGGGAVVQIGGLGGRFAFAGLGAYSASKSALEGLSVALAQEVAPMAIKVLIVEPGALRTGFADHCALVQSEPLTAYADTVGTLRSTFPRSDGAQAGDPAKAAAAILAALNADLPPLRLPLGNDAADFVSAGLHNAHAEFLAWEHLARDIDFDASDNTDG
ncbi:SDR family NAD(P)-dependent oxidoreductase [Yinghuangia aomiensis]